MNTIFYGSPDIKKVYLKKWVESKSDYKKKMKLAMSFRVVAFVILLICIVLPGLLLMGNDAIFKGLFAGTIVGLILALIPFFIGGSIKRKAFYEFSFPFGNIEKECIKIFEDGIEYLYHNTSSDFSESMDIYIYIYIGLLWKILMRLIMIKNIILLPLLVKQSYWHMMIMPERDLIIKKAKESFIVIHHIK